MSVPTANYAFELPEVGSDDDLWGGLLNGNWSALDGLLKTLDDKIEEVREEGRIKIGDLYFSSDATNPATKLGYGTWAVHAAGRAIVGVGTADGTAWTAGQLRGSSNVTLTLAQIPSHRHYNNPPNVHSDYAGDHQHYFKTIASGDYGSDGRLAYAYSVSGTTTYTSPDGSHRHLVQLPSFYSDYSGSSQSHDNIQPSIGVYVWKRTA